MIAPSRTPEFGATSGWHPPSVSSPLGTRQPVPHTTREPGRVWRVSGAVGLLDGGPTVTPLSLTWAALRLLNLANALLRRAAK